MTLGEKIKQARQEAGLSQRQLCGDAITRNMLSQIENGSARPSMDTLRLLAAGLGKTVSYFLEEDAVTSPNLQVMTDARAAFDEKNWARVLKILEDYRQPDELFRREYQLMLDLSELALAEDALAQGKTRYAEELLAEPVSSHYCTEELERRRKLLLARAVPELTGKIARELPNLDEELLLRAAAALEQRNADRSGALLDAAENHNTPRWNYLRGEVYLAKGQYTKAAVCYLKAERDLPERCIPKLEQCYRELGNYEKAYEYACRQKRPIHQ